MSNFVDIVFLREHGDILDRLLINYSSEFHVNHPSIMV